MQHFEKDLPFFDVFFHLLRRSYPVKSVALIWTGHDAAGGYDLDHSPDIAVPIVIKGEQIAALIATQDDIAERPGQEVESITQVLQAFAEFLASGWFRVSEAVSTRAGEGREFRSSCKEFAYLFLEGRDFVAADWKEVRALMRRIRFTRFPNRVLVIRLERPQPDQEEGASFELQFAGAFHAIEQTCERLENAAAVPLKNTSVCVFFHDPAANGNAASQFYSNRLAMRLLEAVRKVCEARPRIGLGRVKDAWDQLGESYREATAALAASDAPIASYQDPSGSYGDLNRYVEEVCTLIAGKRLKEARSAAMSLPVLVSRRTGSKPDDLIGAGVFLSSAMDSILAAAYNLGGDRDAIAVISDTTARRFSRASSALEMRETWSQVVSKVLDEADWLYSEKGKKIISRACRMIDDNFQADRNAQEITLASLAARLGVSTSHMSRTFKREVGESFETYVAAKRVRFGKRLLLDPLNNISQVSRRCGFSDPSYFSRVFRKFVGCTPTEYCQDPLRY